MSYQIDKYVAVKHSIEQQPDHVKITFNEMTNQSDTLISEMKKCMEGHCPCPTEELEQLKDLQISEENSNLIFKLYPPAEHHLNIENLEECVQYIIAQCQRSMDFNI